VRRIVTEGNLCERHARALLRLPTEEMQIAAAKRAVEFQMNVSSTEKMIQKMLEEEPEKKIFKKENTSYEKMCFLFKNTVNKTIDMMKKGGMRPSVTQNEDDDYIEYVIRLSK
jgi:ParB family chromosome partitioning protein